MSMVLKTNLGSLSAENGKKIFLTFITHGFPSDFMFEKKMNSEYVVVWESESI